MVNKYVATKYLLEIIKFVFVFFFPLYKRQHFEIQCVK